MAEPSPPNLVGAVLTGGRSSRMGRDKALIEISGVSMVDRVALTLTHVCRQVIAVGPAHLAGRTTGVPDRWPGEGPLGGILTAIHEVHETTIGVDGVFVVACDLPWIDCGTVTSMAAELATALADRRPFDAIVARTERLQPLCAIWRPSAGAALQNSFDAGQRAVHGAMASLLLRAVDVAAGAMRNVNTPDDLQTE